MKRYKRWLSAVLILCLALPPAKALAAENSYGPDADGYGYTVSETDFALGTIEHDGTGLTKENAFSVTVTNTGEKPIEIVQTFFGRYEVGFDAGNNIPLEPGESTTLRYTMKIEAGAPNRDAMWAQGGLVVDLGGTWDQSFVIYATYNAVNTALLEPEPTPTPSGSGYVDENGQYWGSDNMGNRYLGVQVGGNYGGNTFVIDGGGDVVNLGENLSIREGESYGFTVSPHSLSFDTCFEGEKVDPLYVKLTNTGDTNIDDIYDGFFVSKDYYSPIYWKQVEGKLNSKGELEPGKSVTYELTLNTYQAKSGTETYEGQFLLYSGTGYSFAGGGFGVGKTGHYGKIPGVLTVDYDVRPLSQVKKGDIDWTLSAESIDFGVSNATYSSRRQKSQEKAITVTNRGSQTFVLEAEVDASACKREDGERIFRTLDTREELKPGESREIRVRAENGSWAAGTVEGCKLLLTAYYPDTKEKNTITATIPLSIKYLYDGGYEIKNQSDNSYGTVKTSDGVDRGPYSGNARFAVTEGGSVTFVMTPYDPENYHISDIKINGESVGTSGLVNNTYTISNIQDNYTFEAVFSPGEAPAQLPVEQQPVVGSAEPAAWAAGAVAQAIEEYILPAELQCSYDQPITRREFCALADRLYFQVNGNYPLVSAPPFTDCDDEHVLDMAAVGVVTGVGEGAFNPNAQLTREQAATILARLAGVLDHPLPDGDPAFDDNAAVAAWARLAVGQMQQSGIMGGTGNNQFSPQMPYTREQSVVTIMRMFELLK